jgi:hypothetical protein
MNHIHYSPKLIVLVLIMVFAFGCKSSKKLEAAKAKEKARIEQEQEVALHKQREEEARKREAELRASENEPREVASEVRLITYFNAIANAGNITSANTSINEALTLFASPETPVLIVISESGDQKDYDRPTTIKDYLHYLKDKKKNINTISNLKVDGSGKITEVELKKPL